MDSHLNLLAVSGHKCCRVLTVDWLSRQDKVLSRLLAVLFEFVI